MFYYDEIRFENSNIEYITLADFFTNIKKLNESSLTTNQLNDEFEAIKSKTFYIHDNLNILDIIDEMILTNKKYDYDILYVINRNVSKNIKKDQKIEYWAVLDATNINSKEILVQIIEFI